MKIFVIVACLLSLNVFAKECVQQEGQFFGTVAQYDFYYDQYSQTGYCSFQLQIEPLEYQPSGLCPLDLYLVTANFFTYDLRSQTCPVSANGERISGYVAQKDGVITIQ